MVAGFSYPDGDPGGLDGVARSLGTLSGDLTTEKGNVSSGVATTLRTWEATRSGDFEDAGRGITGTLAGAAGVVDAAQEQVSGFARRLRNAREDIDELERQAQRQLDRMDGLDSEDDDDGIRSSVDTEVGPRRPRPCWRRSTSDQRGLGGRGERGGPEPGPHDADAGMAWADRSAPGAGAGGRHGGHARCFVTRCLSPGGRGGSRRATRPSSSGRRC